MNHFSKFSSMMLALVLALAFAMSLGTVALAADPVVSVGTVKAAAGDTLVIVPVTISDNTGFGFLNFQVDPTPATGIKFLDARGSVEGYTAGICAVGKLEANADTGKIAFAHTENITGTGTMFYLLYSVERGTAVGSHTITMKKSDTANNVAGTTENAPMTLDFTKGAIIRAGNASVIPTINVPVVADNEPDIQEATGDETADEELAVEGDIADDILEDEIPDETDDNLADDGEQVPATGDFGISILPALLPFFSLAFIAKKKR